MKTEQFVNIMFSLSLHLLIVKPSRITKDAATLIDNIFTNVTDVKIVSGLLVTDVSDHLTVFVVLERAYIQNPKEKRKPWFTEGFEKSCKKKNRLYREFITYRTKEKEDKYKKYKNKLTSIMRLHKKRLF